MAYFLNTNIPNKQKVKFALSQIYGIGRIQSQIICQNLGFSENIHIFELTEIQKIKLIRQIENSKLVINSDLKRIIKNCKGHLIEIRAYRGLRSKLGFPIRGQRTHTNGQTAKKFKNL
jgi:small subunit ribosomal protein S13